VSQAPAAARADLKACLTAPDLPGNHWSAGSAKAVCWLVLPQEPSLTEIALALRQSDGSTALDRRYDEILARHYKDPAHRDFLFNAFQDFGTPRGRTVAAEWIAKAPNSPYAQLAQGESVLQQAQAARGSEFIADTPQSQLDEMTAKLRIAVPLLQSALRARPKLSPACVDLMDAASLVSDDDLEAAATKHCMAIDPLSWNVNYQHLNNVDPRWGGDGSYAKLDAAVSELGQHVQESPALGNLLATGIGRRATIGRADSDLAAVASQLDQAALIAPVPNFIAKAGMAAEAQGNHSKALLYVSHALRFMPKNVTFRADRAKVYLGMGNLSSASRDAQYAAIHADADCSCDYDQIADMLGDMNMMQEEQIVLQKSLQTRGSHKWAATELCRTYLSPYNPGHAPACTKDLLDAYPDDPDALYMRAVTLYMLRDPGASDMDARFRKLADPSDRQTPTLLAQLDFLKSHPPPLIFAQPH